MLAVVATPLGNLGDITLRAIESLKNCDLIAAEDTRRTRVLLRHLKISTPLTSYHDQNKRGKTPTLIKRLQQGEHICVVSDAGTPGIADPAFYLVRAAIQHGIRVEPIPGPCAPIAALVASGLPTDAFLFVGFLPKKPGKRKAMITSFAKEKHTVVCFESPHRIIRTLEEFAKLLPDKVICLGRELSKLHEEFIRGSAAEVLGEVRTRKKLGEITLVIGSGQG